jgi:hypothetical protein
MHICLDACRGEARIQTQGGHGVRKDLDPNIGAKVSAKIILEAHSQQSLIIC